MASVGMLKPDSVQKTDNLVAGDDVFLLVNAFKRAIQRDSIPDIILVSKIYQGLHLFCFRNEDILNFWLCLTDYNRNTFFDDAGFFTGNLRQGIS